MGHRVYLAGPITGLSYGEARHGWREEIARLAKERYPHLDLYSPMRAKDFLENSRKIKGTADSYGSAVYGQAQGILTRDHNDVKEAKVMIANFLGATLGSLGTAAEFGFAHAYRVPIVTIIESKERLAVLEAEREMEFRKLLRGAVARAYVHDANSHKVLDNHLVDAIEHEVMKFLESQHLPATSNPHNHVFLSTMTGYVVHDLESALDVTASLVTPGI